MKNVIKTTENWHEKYIRLEEKVAELEALVKFYEGQFRLAKHRQFGASSEKTENPEQLGLFDETENTADPKLSEPTEETIAYTRKKQQGKREDDLSMLPVEVIEHILSEEEQVCPECGEHLHTMVKEIRKELTVIPAQVKVAEHVRHIYSCRNCEKTADHTTIVKAPMSEPVIKGSLASPSAVAHIMVQKYVNAVPLYRQEQGFLRDNIALSRQTMANWMIKCSEDWLEPLYEHLKGHLLKREVLHADETVLQVLNEQGKKASTNSYMWLYRSSGDADHAIVLYEYQPTRSSSHPKRFLNGYSGYLHTDGYAAYHTLTGIMVVGCWAHARRKFDETLKSIPEKERIGSNAMIGLHYCNRLFELEQKYANLCPKERYTERLNKSRPVFDEFYTWVNKVNYLPKTQIGKAIRYAIEQKKYLENVFLDGRLELSNNRAERSIKPFVIGRKNWLFCNTAKGARASSVIYSIIETAKENSLNPFAYLEHIFKTMPNITTGMIGELLPWSESLPDCVKVRRV